MAPTDELWIGLLAKRDALKGRTLGALFAADPQRFAKLHRRAEGMLLDVSKQRLTPEIMDALCAFAERADFDVARQRLFAADIVNASEHRPALHWALGPRSQPPMPRWAIARRPHCRCRCWTRSRWGSWSRCSSTKRNATAR